MFSTMTRGDDQFEYLTKWSENHKRYATEFWLVLCWNRTHNSPRLLNTPDQSILKGDYEFSNILLLSRVNLEYPIRNGLLLGMPTSLMRHRRLNENLYRRLGRLGMPLARLEIPTPLNTLFSDGIFTIN